MVIGLEAIIAVCKDQNIRSVKVDGIEIEFFPSTPTPMALDPLSLSKTLGDSMPPDSSMLFASTEDMKEDSEEKQD